MDFLPTSYWARDARRQARRSSLLLAAVLCCGIVALEGILQLRLKGLRATRAQVAQQAEAASLRSAQIEELHRHQQEMLTELARWSVPLETQRATEILDGILAARPGSIRLQRVDWKSGSTGEASSPTLQIGGILEELGDLVAFLDGMECTEGMPPLEVRRSSVSHRSSTNARQNFVVHSVTAGEGSL